MTSSPAVAWWRWAVSAPRSEEAVGKAAAAADDDAAPHPLIFPTFASRLITFPVREAPWIFPFSVLHVCTDYKTNNNTDDCISHWCYKTCKGAKKEKTQILVFIFCILYRNNLMFCICCCITVLLLKSRRDNQNLLLVLWGLTELMKSVKQVSDTSFFVLLLQKSGN